MYVVNFEGTEILLKWGDVSLRGARVSSADQLYMLILCTCDIKYYAEAQVVNVFRVSPANDARTWVEVGI